MNATSAEQASAPVTEDALRSALLAGERPSRHHRYQARNSRNRPEVQVTEGQPT
jgi:hypothetical protein